MQRELNSSLLTANAVDLSKGRILDIAVRVTVVRNVEEVEAVRTESNQLTLGDMKVLED